MRTILTVSSTKFSLDGISFFKNYISDVAGEQITIFNCYDRKDIKVDYTHYSEITLNGTVYGNVADLQTALLPVIYTRASLAPSGGGVTEFIELTDVPASYTGQGTKVVAVKVDESGLEFVTGGGGTTPTLQAVLDEGKTATFTGVGGEDISISIGGDDGGGVAVDYFIITKTIGDNTYFTQRYQILNGLSYLSSIENSVTGEFKVSVISINNGNFIAQKQNQFSTKTANQNIELEDIAEVDISGTNLDVIFKPKPKFVSGTYYLVDEDYVTNAIAGVTTPDATPTVKGIAKLYTSLGSNTDGAVDQNTVNSALALKANLQNVKQYIISKPVGNYGSVTGTTAETVLLSIPILGGVYENGDYLGFNIWTIKNRVNRFIPIIND